MYTILINEDNTLTASVVERVMQQSKLVAGEQEIPHRVFDAE